MTAPRPRRPRPGAGFTLIELLVVMAIIGVLIALLLPAVQAARGAARRCECLNNLMQMAIGTQNYESAFETLPPGVVNPGGPIVEAPKGYHFSWMAQILPFVEQKGVYNHLNFAFGAYDPPNLTTRAVVIRTFLCPSDTFDEDNDGVALNSYVGNHHHTEAPIDENNTGLYFLNSHLRTEDIEDGASNTIALGEKIRELDLGWASGTRATLRNGGTAINGSGPAPPKPGAAPTKTAGLVGGYSSRHPGGANFAFADGSVRFLKTTTSLGLLGHLSHRADGDLLLENDK